MGGNNQSLGLGPEGSTPLEAEDLEGLIPDLVTTRAELDFAEYENILLSLGWAKQQARSRGPEGVLTYPFLLELHRQMFKDVWKWAGKQRLRLTNLGVDPEQITEQTRQMLDNAKHWHNNSLFSADERAVRLHRGLVFVHPFPNGNGRCTRLLADVYLESIGMQPLTWGGGSGQLEADGTTRRQYLSDLRIADEGDFEPLLVFGRS